MSQNMFSKYVSRVFGGIARRQFGQKASRPRRQYRCPPRQELETLEERLVLTHFRYSNLSWEANTTQANTVDFRLQQAFNLNDQLFKNVSKVGDITTSNNDNLNFGDNATQKIYLKVLSINTTAATFVAEAGHSSDGGTTFVSGFEHTYSKTGDFTAFVQNGNRIDTLKNNAVGKYRFETLVNVGSGNSSPVAALSPVVQVADNTIVSLQVPAVDPDGDTIRYRLATSLEASGTTNYVQPTGLSISSSGVLSWDIRDSGGTSTNVDDLWTAQIVVEDLDSTGAVKSKVPVDFILQVVSSVNNAAPVVATNPSSPFSAVPGQKLTFTVTATDPDSGDSIVSLQLLNPPDGMTFTPDPITPDNPVSITVSWTPTTAQVGKNYVLIFQATDAQGATGIASAIAKVTRPALSIDDVVIVEGTGGTKDAVFTVTLSPAVDVAVTVNFATADGSAIAGTDFTATSGTLSFSAGDSTKTIRVPILGDSTYEPNESFLVNLSSATIATIADAQGQGTIIDDDPVPSLSINDVTIIEGNSGSKNAVFTVTLSGASADPVTVDYVTADGSATAGDDYITNTGTVTFDPGQITQSITIAVKGDDIYEAAEDFLVKLSGATIATINDGQGKGTITNDDAITAKVSIDDIVVTEATGNTVNAVFTVSLSTASGLPVTVNYATGNSTAISPDDFTAGSGTVTFAAGETSQTIIVPVIGDSSYEPTQAFFVNLSAATNASIADAQGKCTILDDDLPPGLSVSDVIVTEQTASVVTAVFIVSLSAPSILPVKVNYATANDTALATDYLSKRGTLLFSPGQVSKTLSISVIGDARDELDEAFFMNLSVPYNAIITDGQGQCTIIDDDATPTLMIDNKTVTEGTGSTVKATFTVHLSAISGLPVTVSYATEDDTATAADYTSANNSLTFLPGQISKTISVPITGDALDEPNETFFVNLSSPNYATLGNNRALGTITDNDATPKLSIGNVTMTEGNSGTVDMVFTVKLSAASGFPVTVNYATVNGSASAGSDYTSTLGLLTFNPGETIKTIVVPIQGDTNAELKKTFSLNLSNALYALFANSQGIGTILDND